MTYGVVKNKYTPTIGIECHIQLKTATKLFAAVGNDAREAKPNTLISHICVGLPGALPVLNEEAIALSAKAAFALGAQPQAFSQFERKHYFYPDLPKGYQITQYTNPIILGGYLVVNIGGQDYKIGIERANLEEDAGKTTHPAGTNYTLVDLNRAGTPLLEIVSKPDIHSSAQAKAFARELWLNMKYAGVTDGDLYHGHVRFDINVSVSSDPGKLGTRSEVKNLNSFRSVEAAVDYEINRQIDLLEKGQRVVQETRGWDEAKQKTTSQRTKEEAHDYRYMPEPDIPPVELSDKVIAGYKKTMPDLPSQIRSSLSKLKIGAQVIEDILDRPEIVPAVIEASKTTTPDKARGIAFRLIEVPEAEISSGKIDVKDHLTIAEMVSAGELSSTAARRLTKEIISSGGEPRVLAKEMNLIQLSDEGEIEKIVMDVIEENPRVAEDIKAGQDKAISFLVGQVMSKTKGNANPALAQSLIKKKLK